MKIQALLLLLVPLVAHAAQKSQDLPCQSRSETPIAARTSRVEDKLVAFTSGGPCLHATLTIELRTATGRLLYSFTRPLQYASLFEWDDSSLARQVETFVQGFGPAASVDESDRLAVETLKSEIYSDSHKLRVSVRDYSRLLGNGQPFIYHTTYYEGGRYLAYDPKMKRVRVLIEWGL